ncbi:PREDICTED: uncharacterized protein LOC104743211 isoform X2 [Camelina sativa]|uniref:Uncharacterized protein LOC104743211 isoform X2 n=1 Tax=Camelina sativa TaxID=90675 RepID=A0ABM1R5F5_CAMSA|nr:PREDICTED: uncharacterized protein LOC104743211 isoform X2 [Camelina sativa]
MSVSGAAVASEINFRRAVEFGKTHVVKPKGKAPSNYCLATWAWGRWLKIFRNFTMDDSTSKFQWGQIMVFWDVEDWSILEKLNPRLVNEKITSDLYENGYLGPEMFNKLTYVFGHAAMRFVHVPKGNKHARVHFITEQLLLWALYGPSRPASLFIISESIKEEKQLVHPILWIGTVSILSF